jgi:hypothetical protein
MGTSKATNGSSTSVIHVYIIIYRYIQIICRRDNSAAEPVLSMYNGEGVKETIFSGRTQRFYNDSHDVEFFRSVPMADDTIYFTTSLIVIAAYIIWFIYYV